MCLNGQALGWVVELLSYSCNIMVHLYIQCNAEVVLITIAAANCCQVSMHQCSVHLVSSVSLHCLCVYSASGGVGLGW